MNRDAARGQTDKPFSGGVCVRGRQPLVLEPTPSSVARARRAIRARLATAPGTAVNCMVLDTGVPRLATIDAVARLQLTALRAGGSICLVEASPELCAVLALAGLPASTGLRVQMIRHSEQRKEAGRVQEEGDSADSVA